MSQTGQMPPFPTLDESMIQRTPEEDNAMRTRMSLGGLPGVPGGNSYKDSYIAQRLGELHKMHVDTARRHFGNIQNYYYALDNGKNPETGQPLTDDERSQYQNMLEGSWDDLMKTPGLDKDAKAEMQTRRDMMGQVLTHGREKVAHTAIGLSGPDQSLASAQPPSPTDVGTSDVSGNVGSMPPLPAPPQAPAPPQGHVLPGEMLTPFTQASAAGNAKGQELVAERGVEASAAGLKPGTPEYEYKMGGGTLPPIATATATYKRADGSMFTGRSSPAGILNVDTGELEPGAVKATAAQQNPNEGVVEQNGIPAGFKRYGKDIFPGDPDWTSDDTKHLEGLQSAHKQQQEEVIKMRTAWANALAEGRSRYQLYEAMDLTTGNPTRVSGHDWLAHPEKYAPLSQAQTLVNRDKVFDELNYSLKQLDTSLNELDEKSDFSDEAKAKLAFALRAIDPQSAVSTLINTGALGTLNDAQLKYTAALISARESVMSLRSIGGMGAGSDAVRERIEAMVPGPMTPTKAYGKDQMRLLHGEVDTLHKAIPPAIRNVGNGNTNGTGNFPGLPGGSGGAGADLGAAPAGATEGRTGKFKGQPFTVKNGRMIATQGQ